MDETIIITDKTNTSGQMLDVGELLKALNHEAFDNPEGLVLIHNIENQENDPLPITAVFMCGNCDKLHIDSGWGDTSDLIIDRNSIIYQDYRDDTHPETEGITPETDEVGLSITKEELIEILETINKEIQVAISSPPNINLHPLTLVMKCCEMCPSVHLMSGYEIID